MPETMLPAPVTESTNPEPRIISTMRSRHMQGDTEEPSRIVSTVVLRDQRPSDGMSDGLTITEADEGKEAELKLWSGVSEFEQIIDASDGASVDKLTIGTKRNEVSDRLQDAFQLPDVDKEALAAKVIDALYDRFSDRVREDDESEAVEGTKTFIQELLMGAGRYVDIPVLDKKVLLKAAELGILSDSLNAGELSEAVYSRFYNEVLTDEAPAIFSNPDFTETLLNRHLLNAQVEEAVSPEELITKSREVGKVMVIHLVALGFEPNQAAKLTDAWATLSSSAENTEDYDKFATNAELTQQMIANIDTIAELELEAPGLAKQLFEERGIAHFGRYSKELLLAQMKPLPEGMKADYLVLPYADHNDAFSGTAHLVEGASSDGTDTVKIVEAETVETMMGRLDGLVRTYRESNNIIIGAHGQEKSFSFGEPKSGVDGQVSISIDQVKDKFGALIQYVRQGGHVILVSCSTGAEGGIGTEIANLMGNDVQAPAVPSNLAKLVKTPDGKFVATFYEDTRHIKPENPRDEHKR